MNEPDSSSRTPGREGDSQRKTLVRNLLLFSGAFVGPFLLLAAYVPIGRWTQFDYLTPYVFIGMLLSAGAMAILRTSVSWPLRLAVVIFYLPFMYYWLHLCVLIFVGWFYDEWL